MNAKLVQAIALVLLGGLIYSTSFLTPAINAGREKMNMFGQTDVQEVAPPEYAFAIQAFGAFRGLLTDIAFIRAESLKQEGRYYDAMQLASWICKLQPRFPSVWEFHSWNMAWNISVTTYTPEERWNWVYNGVKLIRDEGIVWNPRAVNLYKQLAWIFNNKMSENVDEFHRTYKRNWAMKMHLVLGPPPDPLGDYRPDQPFEAIENQIGDDLLANVARREKEIKDLAKEEIRKNNPDWEISEEKVNTASRPANDPALLTYRIVQKAFYDFIKHIGQAPPTLKDLYAATPDTQPMVAALREMGVPISDARLGEDTYTAADGLERTFFLRYRKLLDRKFALRSIVSKTEVVDPDMENVAKLGEILGVKTANAAGLEVVRFLQRKVLREVYKLEPAKMASLIGAFGPLDWRVVDSQSLYWVNEGLIAGGETVSKIGNDKTNTARLIFFSLRNLFHRNRLTFEPCFEDVNLSYMNYAPDLNIIEPMHKAFFTYGPLIDPEPTTTGAGGTFKTGHVNFLIESIQLLWFANRKDEAARYYQYLRDNYAFTDTGERNHTFDMPLPDFVVAQFVSNMDGSENEMRDAVNGVISYAFDVLSNGDLAQYNLLLSQAAAWHRKYNNPKSEAGKESDRINLAPIPELCADILRSKFRDPAAGQELTLRKARLWMYLPPNLQMAIYDDVQSALSAECNLWSYDPARAFPEPKGMADYRATHPGRKREEDKKKDIDTPAQNVQ